jgi:hypothetical protein
MQGHRLAQWQGSLLVLEGKSIEIAGLYFFNYVFFPIFYSVYEESTSCYELTP